VRIDPQDPDRYLTADGSEAFAHFEESIPVAGGEPERLEIRETRWGPVLATDVDGVPLALAWTAHREGAVNLELQQLDTAQSADEAIGIAQRAGMPAQNFLVADRFGNIAWTIAGAFRCASAISTRACRRTGAGRTPAGKAGWRPRRRH
jgi:penicillin amidase